MKRILEEQPDIEISNARRIVDTRNRIIHGYDAVSVETIWGIVQRHLPILRKEIRTLSEATDEP